MSELAQGDAVGVRGAGREGDRLATTIRRVAPAVAGYTLPFLFVLYLALEGGGYDAVVRGEVGIAVWWIVLIGAAIGVLPATRLSRTAWAAIGLMTAFAVWAGLSIGWSESAERSSAELARLATYAGIFALALAAQGRDGLRRTLGGVAAAIAVVSILALASRLHPDWFPTDQAAAAIEEARNRLNYPLNYWNGLAALIAIGIPPIIYLAWGARHLAARALAAAAVPAMSVAVFFTLSRAGALAFAAAAVALVALHPRRLSLVPTLANVGVGSILGVAAASQRDALTDAVGTAAASREGDEMFAVVLVICAGVGLIQAALGLADRYGVGPADSEPVTANGNPRDGRRHIAAAALALVGGSARRARRSLGRVQGPDRRRGRQLRALRQRQRQRPIPALGGGARRQATEPLTGSEPGTYELFYAREGERPGFVRDAHSLFLETLAELGIVGLLLIEVGLLLIAVVAVSRAHPRGDRSCGPLFARRSPQARSHSRSASPSIGPGSSPSCPRPSCCSPRRALGAPRDEAESDGPGGDRPRAHRARRHGDRGHGGDRDPTGDHECGAGEPGRGRPRPARRPPSRTPGPRPRSSPTPRRRALQEALVLELAGDLDAAAASARRRPRTSRPTGRRGSSSRGSRLGAAPSKHRSPPIRKPDAQSPIRSVPGGRMNTEPMPTTTELERRLLEDRALPSAGFRSAPSRLTCSPASTAHGATRAPAADDRGLRGSGFALLLVAAVGVAGAGPLAA